MSPLSNSKSWISPVLCVLFITLSASGMLMSLHIKGPSLFHAHVFTGWVFIVLGAVHLALNWKSLCHRLLQPRAIAAMVLAAFLVLGIFLYDFPGHEAGRQYRNGHGNQAALDVPHPRQR